MQNIRITETGVYINQDGNTISYDKNSSLMDYKPELNSNSSWTGILNKGDEVSLQMSKFMFLRARGLNEPVKTDSCNFTNFTNYCSPAHNTLINSCGCCSNVGGSDTILEFQMNSYTNFKLDSKTLFLDSEHILDCTDGNSVLESSPTEGWTGPEMLECVTCEEPETPLENRITIQGTLSNTCVSTTPIQLNGIYNFVFIGVLENNGLVIKSTNADNDYNIKNDYYAYVKNDNSRILIIFNSSKGAWDLLELDTPINEIVENLTEFNIIEAYRLGSYADTQILTNTNIYLPQNVDILYTGEKNILDTQNIVKVNNLLVIESDRFDGKIVCKSDNVKLSINLGM